MKVCKYCDSQSLDSVSVCPNCGASDFLNICPNCRTVHEGEYCPDCGVKAGTRAKRCPNCGTSYYSAACPDCGYVRKEKPVYTPPSYSARSAEPVAPQKKRKTWLWVLGWIFIFPLPLTILLLRNQKMAKGLKIFLIVIAWLIYLSFAGAESDAAYIESPGAPVIAADAAVD